MTEPASFVTVDDYEPIARERLPADVYDYLAGGAGDEWTLLENHRAFERWTLRPRFLRAVGEPDPSCEVLGTRVSAPILVAPWAYQRLVHPDGELATARAAAAAATIMVVSTTTMDYLEEVAAAAPGPKWWQLYVFDDRNATAAMLDRVVAAGFEAICLTVDFPTNGLRHRDTRSGFQMPIGLPDDELTYDPMLSWDDLGWIRERTPGLPLVVKGILTAEDAILAADAGVDAIVVSNHGGRQLDSSPATITVLPEIVDAVGGRMPVLLDGGIRRGTDVLKALALGARAVLIGRPCAWGLAVAGEEGVIDVLRILREELRNAMALSGCRSLEEIASSLVVPTDRSLR
jgi:isopentenyl diphosphate isomerase/L-lactate dehydrogenase-like FMN-dependent dehydrogenase